MLYHYIFQNQFITSDEELSADKYPIGQDMQDYVKGMYVPLNEDQIQYEEEHPNASPEEVWEMHEVPYVIHVHTPQDDMNDYYDQNCNIVYLNGEAHRLWEHKDIVYNAECAKIRGRQEFIFMSNGKYFKGDVDNIIDMMRQISLYYYDLKIAMDRHYNYINKHPEEIGTYNYTANLPTVLHFNLEEVYDIE